MATETVERSTKSGVTNQAPKMPPRWFVHLFWRVHRGLYRLSGGRFLWTPASKRGWGALHLTTIGRKSGEERSVIVGYLEDGTMIVVESGSALVGSRVKAEVTSVLQSPSGKMIFSRVSAPPSARD